MSRMFEINGHRMHTWNCFIGCEFECQYCSARRMAETRLKHHPEYAAGFTPHLVPSRLGRQWQKGDWVFIGYMGDIAWANRSDMDEIWRAMMSSPETNFLLMSKQPAVFRAWQESWGYSFAPNVVLGTTIETNRYELTTGLSRAPAPSVRAFDMMLLTGVRKIISIEPIMDFDVDILAEWVQDIRPEIVFVGADNYHHHLPEPPWAKVKALLARLRQCVPTVVEKSGLDRLKEDAR